jgi:predicted RND superfamily exporter protein
VKHPARTKFNLPVMIIPGVILATIRVYMDLLVFSIFNSEEKGREEKRRKQNKNSKTKCFSGRTGGTVRRRRSSLLA